MFHRYLQYLCKTEDIMKHGVTNITNRKYNRNDIVTLKNNLCQPDVECYEKYGTNINVTKNNLCQPDVECYEKYGTNINVTNTSF